MKVYIVISIEPPEGVDAVDFGIEVANAIVEVAQPGVSEHFGVDLRIDEVEAAIGRGGQVIRED